MIRKGVPRQKAEKKTGEEKKNMRGKKERNKERGRWGRRVKLHLKCIITAPTTTRPRRESQQPFPVRPTTRTRRQKVEGGASGSIKHSRWVKRSARPPR